MPHGGKRTPDSPAAVSGPGKLSRRTDGGPGKRLEFGDYDSGQVGEAQRLAAMQDAAPRPGRGGGQAGPPSRGQAGLDPVSDPFGPSGRPNEPLTAGMENPGDPVIPPDPYEFVRALYARHPHPDLLRVLQFANQNRPASASNTMPQQQTQQPAAAPSRPQTAPQSAGTNQPVSGL